MHIVVAHSQLNTFGGGERSVLALLSYLSRRHDVTLWAGAYDPTQTYAELRGFPRYDVPPIGWLWQTPRADAVITHSFGAHLLALRHPRTLCYIHTLRSIYLRGGSHPALIARRHLDRAAVRRAAAVLTNSAFTAAEAQRRYERAVEVVPPGAADALFDLPLRAGEYVLYVGRLAPEKGIERLLRWWDDLPFELVVVGAGDPNYVKHIRSLAGNRTRFLGPLTGGALYGLYAGCRCLTFLPFEEEFGLVALEAMAAAKPVVTVHEGGLIELVRSEETGIYVQDAGAFQSSIRRLFEDEVLALRLGQSGRERARNYTWERYAQQIEAHCEMQVEREGEG